MSIASEFKAALPELAKVWLTAYVKAVKEGLHASPSGPFFSDQRCLSAAAITNGLKLDWRARGRLPAIYGGNVRYKSDEAQWSALRRAAITVFEHGVFQLRLEPGEAARAFFPAQKVARRALGIDPGDAIRIETWLKLSPGERQQRTTALTRARRLNALSWELQTVDSYRHFSLEWRFPVSINRLSDLPEEKLVFPLSSVQLAKISAYKMWLQGKLAEVETG